MKELVKQNGLKSTVRVNSAGCLDACEFGPVLVRYPEARWYGGVDAEDVGDLFEREIICGESVDRLRIEHPAFNSGEV